MFKIFALAILSFAFLGPIFAQPPHHSGPVCNPYTCSGTYCCDSSGQCAQDENSCVDSVCSVNCRNGCCVDNNRCGTSHECSSLPILTIVLSVGGFVVFLLILGLYKMSRSRRTARMRVIPVRIQAQALSELGMIPTGTIVNARTNNRRSFNPPIKEAEVQPFQHQDISMTSAPMARPYTILNGQRMNYDQIEYGVSSPLTSASPTIDLKPNT